MSEKIYACLLRLYPFAFRTKYQEEALQLYRDRLRDEAGTFHRCQLYCDLLVDALIGLPQAWRNTYAATSAPSLVTNANNIPSFRILDKQPLRPASILIGSTLSFVALSAFGLMMSLPIPSRSFSMLSHPSPIESVMERLNRAVAQDNDDQITNANASTSDMPQPSASDENVAEPKPEDAIRAMIRLLSHRDIVMFGEIHSSKQEYEWLCKLVKTPAFADQVDDIVVEFGNALYQKDADRYVDGEDVPFDQVQKAWRNTIGSIPPVSPVYGWFYQAVRDANLQKRGKHKIRLLMGSPPGDWDKIKTTQDLAPYEAQREQWYLHVVKDEVLGQHHRALLIMGSMHFLRGSDQALHDELLEQQHKPVPAVDRQHLAPGYIERELRAAGAHPYLAVMGTDVVDDRGDVDPRIDSWLTPALITVQHNWLGDLPAQPIISGGHAPATPLTVADQTDAIIYVAPCSVLKFVNDSPVELDGTPYGKEMIRRNIIEVGHPLPFQYGESPECVQGTHDPSSLPSARDPHQR
jgi:hypothetical protein